MSRASDPCPTCRTPLPALKTCASETCDVEFYRSEGGRADAKYHSRACARAQAQRELRRRRKQVSVPAGAAQRP